MRDGVRLSPRQRPRGPIPQAYACKRQGRFAPCILEQVAGIGPANYAWEAHILPLNYTCVKALYHFLRFFQTKNAAERLKFSAAAFYCSKYFLISWASASCIPGKILSSSTVAFFSSSIVPKALSSVSIFFFPSPFMSSSSL